MTPTWQTDDCSIQLHNATCEAVLPTLSGVDVFFTSPRYNLGNTTGGGFPPLGHYDPAGGYSKRGGGGKWQAASRADGLANGYGEPDDDNTPHDEYVAWQHSILRLMWAALSDNGAIFYNHKPRVLGGRLVTPFEYIPPELPIRQNIIWARAGGINFSPAFYLPTHEWIVVIAKDSFRLRSKGASGVGDVWQVAQEESKLHPCAFPVELPSRALSTINPGVVCDPFGGIFTTGVAAIRHGWRFIGIEKSPVFYGRGRERLLKELAIPAMFSEPPSVQKTLMEF